MPILYLFYAYFICYFIPISFVFFFTKGVSEIWLSPIENFLVTEKTQQFFLSLMVFKRSVHCNQTNENHLSFRARQVTSLMYQNSNMAQWWLRDFQDKIAKLLSFICVSIPKEDVDVKKTPPNTEVCLEFLGARIMKYRTWLCVRVFNLLSMVYIEIIEFIEIKSEWNFRRKKKTLLHTVPHS